MVVHLLCALRVLYVAASATNTSLVQRNRTVRVCVCLTVCDPETSTVRWPRSHMGCGAPEKSIYISCSCPMLRFTVCVCFFYILFYFILFLKKAEDPQ